MKANDHLQEVLREATEHHRQGHYDEAEHLYHRILQDDPQHFDVLNRLAIVALQRGDFELALDRVKLALRVRPDAVAALSNKGSILFGLKRFDEALAAYDRSIQLDPSDGDAHYNRGNVLKELLRHREAVESYDEAIRLRPDDADAHSNRGTVLSELKRFDDALASYEKAIELDPLHVNAFSNRGATLARLERFDEALASLDRAVALNPRSAEAHYNRANALLECNRLEEALASYDTALILEPDHVGANINRGNALYELKHFEEALAGYDRGIALEPHSVDAHFGRGNALLGLKRLPQALASYDKALALRPDYADAFCNRGNVLSELKRPEEALASYDRATALKPDFADAFYNRGNALRKFKFLAEATDSYRRALEIQPRHWRARAEFVQSSYQIAAWEGAAAAKDDLLHDGGLDTYDGPPFAVLPICDDPATQKRVAESYVRNVIPAIVGACREGVDRRDNTRPDSSSADFPHGVGQSSKLRLGYLSADFRQHPVGALVVELIELHDRSRFEVFGFSSGPDDSSRLRQRIKDAFDVFVDVQTMSDSEVRQAIEAARIDLVVDLAGHTEGGRISALARRAAPLQVTYLGYPATTGAAFIDYAIVDNFIVPEREAEFFTEKLAYLPHCYLVSDRNRPIAEHQPSRADFQLPEGCFVFCCFNGAHKINPQVFDVWMRLLAAVPGSVLWLVDHNAWASANLRKEAQRRGVDPARLVFASHLSYADHLAALRLADLFLDTWPYNAHTTASDALWVGLPVLTYSGRCFASRVAGSLLHAIGMPELVASSTEAYETQALAIARDPARLAALRERLAGRRLTAPLYDTDLFRGHIEAAYETMWKTLAQGKPPCSFHVPA